MAEKEGANKSEFLKVGPETSFYGFDAYKKLLQTDVDVVILATPPVFRPDHLKACFEAGKHVFAEKPVCVDNVQAQRLYHEINPIAKKKGLTVICGRQTRYHKGYQEAIERLRNGEIGDVVGLQCYFMASNYVSGQSAETFDVKDPNEMEYQIRKWPAFIWASGDQPVEQAIHKIDTCMWAMNEEDPIEVIATGGRTYGTVPYPAMGDRFTHFAMEFKFKNGANMLAHCRQEPGTSRLNLERICGTKAYLELELAGSQKMKSYDGKVLWQIERGKVPEPLVEEHRVLLDSIRNSKAENTLDSMTKSCLVAVAGRESAYSGVRFNYNKILQSKQDLMPKELKFGKLPVGKIPVPGEYRLV
jgi:predicted dehydrogenase